MYKLPLILFRRTSFGLAFFCLLIWSQAFTAPPTISGCRVGAFSGSLMSTSPTSYCTLTVGWPLWVTSINCEIINASTVIFLQIVMLSPGTHLVKNHGSQCRTNESQFKKQWILNWKCLGLSATRQLIWRQTPKLFTLSLHVVQFTKIKNIVVLFKAQKRLK